MINFTDWNWKPHGKTNENRMKEKDIQQRDSELSSECGQVYHIPALLEETMDLLAIKPDGIYADATFGGGGHSRAILERLGPKGHLYGFDQDIDAYANCIDDPRFTFVHSNFRYMPNFMRYYGVAGFDGILADLGVSFHHFDEADRGFSFRADAPLDMRMNQKAERTAAGILRDASEEELTSILRRFTDLKQPKKIAKSLLKAREKEGISTTVQLTEAVEGELNPKNQKKELSQIFQALRIATNSEMEALEAFLLNAPKVLKPGGRMAVLTYHSIEDRMVKNVMKSGRLDGEEEKDFFGRISTPWKIITRSPITADAEEVERNPRSRSAKLRVAELNPDDNDIK